jgi:RNA polymerase sigma-70 factor (ECF subfamily)
MAAAILAGDEAAKEKLYRQCYRKLYVTAAHFLGASDPEIEDAVQDTFIKGFDALAEFRFQASLATWLNHICVNLCYDRLRKRKRLLLAQSQDLEQAAQGLARRSHQILSQQEEARAQAQVIHRHLAGLGEPCRSILERRELQGQAYAAIAKAMRMPIGTVMSRLSRCREALRESLLKEDGGKP